MGGSLLTQCMAEVVQSAGTKIHPRFEFSREEVAPGQFEVKYEPRRRLGLDGKPRVVDVSASYRQHAILQIAQDIKEAVCRVSDAPFDPEENANIPQASYELPDGQEISVGVDRFALCECLFNTSLLERYGAAAQGLLAAAGAEAGGDGPASLQAAINDCITRCDVDARRELYANVLLTGGTAGFASLKDRLERELTEVAPALARVKVSAPVNAVERRFSVWIGGSILASLGSFQQMWMSKAEYAEYGAGLIHKKAP
ncbi:hypothetical protein QBZ16_003542 [Prototheca wickerhamii]|uniref:Uncharacterized protein n=1 Tax=Prototheca wickerhamii TaxID=3111 RepID=A0AAD9IMH9_PROWI|nr:hypothetical protein QBZ16_003542 [Prototheca wickerhamii]